MRFLCLHGMGASAKIVESQLSHIKSNLPGIHDFVFVDGAVESEPLYGIDAFFPGPYYSHYILPTPDEMQNAYDLIDEVIEEDGPFDGVIGFSQGAALASSYILHDSRSEKPRSPFRCAIFFCASAPWDRTSPTFLINHQDRSCRMAESNEPMTGFDLNAMMPEAAGSNGWSGTVSEDTALLHRYGSPYANPEKAQITIPTTHIVGTTDDYLKQSLLLRDLCTTQGRHFFQHSRGHEIPTDSRNTSKMVAEIHSMLQAVLVG